MNSPVGLRARLFHLELDTSRLLTQPLTAKLLNMARSQPFSSGPTGRFESDSCYPGRAVVGSTGRSGCRAGPSQELLATIIEEGFQPEDAGKQFEHWRP